MGFPSAHSVSSDRASCLARTQVLLSPPLQGFSWLVKGQREDGSMHVNGVAWEGRPPQLSRSRLLIGILTLFVLPFLDKGVLYDPVSPIFDNLCV